MDYCSGGSTVARREPIGHYETCNLQTHPNLASKGARKGDLSRFIEKAVRAHLFDLAAKQAKEANADLSEDDLTSIVKEAVDWARR